MALSPVSSEHTKVMSVNHWVPDTSTTFSFCHPNPHATKGRWVDGPKYTVPELDGRDGRTGPWFPVPPLIYVFR